MTIDVLINRLPSGRTQICVAKPGANPNPVQTYGSFEEARCVLLAFGINENHVSQRLDRLSEIEPHELLKFESQEVARETLWVYGFKV